MRQTITKFGGTSVSSRETWDNILSITRRHIDKGLQPVIVCSALTKISDKLEKAIEAALLNEHHHIFQDISDSYVKLANELGVSPELLKDELQNLQHWLTGIALLKQAPAKTRAEVMSVGELMMTRLGHAFLNQQGVDTFWFDAREVLVCQPLSKDETINYLSSRCEADARPDVADRLSETGAKAVITQGFIASNPDGETVLLGRGGSDTSAGLLAALLQAESCEIWTDVPGIYTANPHQLPHARLLKKLHYNEAQEIASMGAKVLHPNSITPVRRAGIPMAIRYTRMPEHSGTLVSKEIDENAPLIKSIQVKHSITLISIDTLNMWQQVGFLADVFATFKEHGFSIDLLSSSEFNVTVSLDNTAKLYNRKALDLLMADLNRFGRAKIIEPCSAVSLVGHHIRTVLPQLGPALEVFEDKQVYLMSLASNDLNLTFVVDESQANKLSNKLHHLLIESNPVVYYYSKSWHEEFGEPIKQDRPWWEKERQALLDLAQKESPCYVYNQRTLARRSDEMLSLKSIDQVYYAMKANPNEAILDTLYHKGMGFECVSLEELKLIYQRFPELDRQRILFTPNFAPREEYEFALKSGCHVTIDSLYPLQNWPELFKDQSIIVRIDPGVGAGHHKHVCTGGNESKFGIVKDDLEELKQLIKKNHVKVKGLHTHSGSGILTVDLWQETALMLAELSEQFDDVESINLGGGLGVAEKPGQQPLDFKVLDSALAAVKSRYPQLKFWMEPGRFFVSECGVILAKVTQRKEKGKVRFVGIETGMNSLIRPALYGAYHEIVNLTRLGEEKIEFAHVVGPICESGDTLGYDRMLPETKEGDVLLIANAGAYGHCMSSHYNLRAPAQELAMD